MTRARVLQEVRQMRFEELYARRQQRELTMAEAAEMLGVMEGKRGVEEESRLVVIHRAAQGNVLGVQHKRPGYV